MSELASEPSDAGRPRATEPSPRGTVGSELASEPSDAGRPRAAEPSPRGTVGGELYLLRHGETEWSRTGRHTGVTDLPLTAAGERDARDAGRLLAAMRGETPPALVASSPRTRAMRTAELAGLSTGLVTEDLAEWDYGEYEGLSTPTIRETVPGWTVWTHPCPGGETAEQVGARAARMVERVRAALSDGDVILVGHGHFSRVLVATWLGLTPASGVHFGLEAAAVSVLGDERGAPQLKRLNVPPTLEQGVRHAGSSGSPGT